MTKEKDPLLLCWNFGICAVYSVPFESIIKDAKYIDNLVATLFFMYSF